MNSGDASSSAPSNVAADWLSIAVRRGYLSQQQAGQLAEEAAGGNWSAPQLAVERGLVTPVERDIVEALLAPEDVAPGYRVIDVIGCGGLGVVYRAQQVALDRPVALKTVLVTRLNTPGTLARFQQEARTIGGLRHPNIVTAFDTGTHAGRLFLAMELVDGADLTQMIRQRGWLDEFSALWITRQVAGGLAHAAERNIVHRDIKPANILATAAPQGYPLPAGVPLAKITDFGLALLAAEGDSTRLTLAGTTMGTPHYMAPEQLAGSTVDLRADIYALGATLYHLLAGAAPFEGATMAQIMAQRMKGQRKPIVVAARDLSPRTAELVEAMMAETPADRPADYQRLLAMIDEALAAARPQGTREMTPTSPAIQTGQGAGDTDHKLAPTRTMIPVAAQATHAEETRAALVVPVPESKKRWRRLAIAAVVVAGAAAAVWGTATAMHNRAARSQAPLAAASDRDVPLFDGTSLTGWELPFRGSWGQGRDAEGGFVLQGSSTPGQTAQIKRSLPAPDGAALTNFRVQLDVDARGAGQVEVRFGASQSVHAIRLAKTTARLGAYDNESHFQPSGASQDLAQPAGGDAPAYRNLKIDHAAGQWRVYVDDKLIGSLPAASDTDGYWLALVVDEGTANFASLLVVELASERAN